MQEEKASEAELDGIGEAAFGERIRKIKKKFPRGIEKTGEELESEGEVQQDMEKLEQQEKLRKGQEENPLCQRQVEKEQATLCEEQQPSRDELRWRLKNMFSKHSHKAHKETWAQMQERTEKTMLESSRHEEECRKRMQEVQHLEERCKLDLLELLSSAEKRSKGEPVELMPVDSSKLEELKRVRQDLTQELQRRADEKPVESSEIQEQFEAFERSWQGVQRKLNGVPEDCKSRPEEESVRRWSLECSRQQERADAEKEESA